MLRIGKAKLLLRAGEDVDDQEQVAKGRHGSKKAGSFPYEEEPENFPVNSFCFRGSGCIKIALLDIRGFTLQIQSLPRKVRYLLANATRFQLHHATEKQDDVLKNIFHQTLIVGISSAEPDQPRWSGAESAAAKPR